MESPHCDCLFFSVTPHCFYSGHQTWRLFCSQDLLCPACFGDVLREESCALLADGSSSRKCIRGNVKMASATSCSATAVILDSNAGEVRGPTPAPSILSPKPERMGWSSGWMGSRPEEGLSREGEQRSQANCAKLPPCLACCSKHLLHWASKVGTSELTLYLLGEAYVVSGFMRLGGPDTVFSWGEEAEKGLKSKPRRSGQ